MSNKGSEVNISRELNHAKSTLIGELERASKYVAVAEQLSKLSNTITLPDSSLDFTFGFSPIRDASDPSKQRLELGQEVLDDFYSYSARYSVIVMITACETFLIRLFWLAKLCHWIKDNVPQLPQYELYRLGKIARKTARRSSTPGLAEKIAREVGKDTDFENFTLFKTIYAARNCLTHRGGKVGREDVEEDGTLKLVWKKLQILVDGEPQDKIRGLHIKAGSQVGIRFIVTKRELKIGETLTLTSQDSQNIALTIAAFAEDMRIMLNEAAQQTVPFSADKTRK